MGVVATVAEEESPAAGALEAGRQVGPLSVGGHIHRASRNLDTMYLFSRWGVSREFGSNEPVRAPLLQLLLGSTSSAEGLVAMRRGMNS